MVASRKNSPLCAALRRTSLIDEEDEDEDDLNFVESSFFQIPSVCSAECHRADDEVYLKRRNSKNLITEEADNNIVRSGCSTTDTTIILDTIKSGSGSSSDTSNDNNCGISTKSDDNNCGISTKSNYNNCGISTKSDDNNCGISTKSNYSRNEYLQRISHSGGKRRPFPLLPPFFRFSYSGKSSSSFNLPGMFFFRRDRLSASCDVKELGSKGEEEFTTPQTTVECRRCLDNTNTYSSSRSSCENGEEENNKKNGNDCEKRRSLSVKCFGSSSSFSTSSSSSVSSLSSISSSLSSPSVIKKGLKFPLEIGQKQIRGNNNMKTTSVFAFSSSSSSFSSSSSSSVSSLSFPPLLSATSSSSSPLPSAISSGDAHDALRQKSRQIISIAIPHVTASLTSPLPSDGSVSIQTAASSSSPPREVQSSHHTSSTITTCCTSSPTTIRPSTLLPNNSNFPETLNLLSSSSFSSPLPRIPFPQSVDTQTVSESIPIVIRKAGMSGRDRILPRTTTQYFQNSKLSLRNMRDFRKALEHVVDRDPMESLQQAASIRGGERCASAMRMTRSWFVEVVVWILVLVYCVAVWVETSLGNKFYWGKDGIVDVSHWVYLQYVIMGLFAIELFLKIVILGLEFAKETYNCIDLGIALLSIVPFSICILLSRYGPESTTTAAWRKLLILRIIRVMRVAHLLRYYTPLRELWVLIRGVTRSLKVLLWGMLLTALMIYIFAVFATTMIGFSVDFEGNEPVQKQWGTVVQSMIGLFQIMTLDDWMTLIEPLLIQQRALIIFFILFIMLSVFALTNLMTAVIVESALNIAREDEYEADRDSRAKCRKMQSALESLMGKESLTLTEYRQLCEQPTFRRLMRAHGFDITDVEILFEMLRSADDISSSSEENEEEMVRIEHFILGMQRLKGSAKSKDVLESLSRLSDLEEYHHVILSEITLNTRILKNCHIVMGEIIAALRQNALGSFCNYTCRGGEKNGNCCPGIHCSSNYSNLNRNSNCNYSCQNELNGSYSGNADNCPNCFSYNSGGGNNNNGTSSTTPSGRLCYNNNSGRSTSSSLCNLSENHSRYEESTLVSSRDSNSNSELEVWRNSSSCCSALFCNGNGKNSNYDNAVIAGRGYSGSSSGCGINDKNPQVMMMRSSSSSTELKDGMMMNFCSSKSSVPNDASIRIKFSSGDSTSIGDVPLTPPSPAPHYLRTTASSALSRPLLSQIQIESGVFDIPAPPATSISMSTNPLHPTTPNLLPAIHQLLQSPSPISELPPSAIPFPPPSSPYSDWSSP